MSELANTPEPPYVAVIFSSLRTPADDGYAETAARMDELAADQPGYLGIEAVRATGDGTETTLGITVSYWRTEEDARNWKRVAEHRAAQREGRERWYDAYTLRIARWSARTGSSGISSRRSGAASRSRRRARRPRPVRHAGARSEAHPDRS